ncbi:MAG: ribosome small subunit-dependent GTPase A, partial [Gammaproteobacteria bacterium]
MPIATRRGLVIVRHRRETAIEDGDGRTLSALVRGRKLRPLTGDEVEFSIEPDGTAVIREILPRKTLLERIDSRGRAEGVAANVTLIAVVIAPEPAPDWQLVDRYFVGAALSGIDGAVIRNKADIADSSLDERASTYRDIGYELVTTSVNSGVGLDVLATALQGRRGVLVGQSGVGKSSLINALIENEAQAVGSLSRRKALGRHTTTSSMLYRLPGGGELIDSPGVRRYAPSISDPRDLASGFLEFRPLADQCRFSDCRHRNEPDCAVRSAVETGEIRRERYASYLALAETIKSI